MYNNILVGQTYEDCDKRQKGRRIEVLSIGETHIVARVISSKSGKTGHHTKIAIERMQPGSKGYKLVKPPQVVSE